MNNRTYKVFIILKVPAVSKGVALDTIWKLIPEAMKQYVENVSGSEIVQTGWVGTIKKQLRGK